MEKTSNLKVYLTCAIISAAVSAITTAVTTRFMDIIMPTTQRMVLESQKQKKSHLEILRETYPPFVYAIEYERFQAREKFSFLKFKNIPPRWIYKLRIANLTSQEIENLDIRVEYPQEVIWLQVYANSDATNQNGEVIRSGFSFHSEKHVESLSYTVDKLMTGVGITSYLYFYCENKIAVGDFKITIVSPEGSFTKITPIQYANIGWENST
jgi:hypothetical protein